MAKNLLFIGVITGMGVVMGSTLLTSLIHQQKLYRENRMLRKRNEFLEREHRIATQRMRVEQSYRWQEHIEDY